MTGHSAPPGIPKDICEPERVELGHSSNLPDIPTGRGANEVGPIQPDEAMHEQFFDCSTPGLSEDAVNKIRHEASLQYETKVLEVVTEASSHIEAANNRAENAEWQAKQALEQVQHMRAFMRTQIGRQQN